MGETTAEEVTLTGFKSVITALVCLNKKNDYATQSIPHVKSLTKTRLGIGWIRPGNSQFNEGLPSSNISCYYLVIGT